MPAYLEEIWKEVTAGTSEDVSQEWWRRITKKYSDSTRMTNTFEDLQRKFQDFESVRGVLENPDAVALTLFFHNFEYNPQAGDMEENNIENFLKFADEAGISCESSLRIKVVDLLHAAQKHCTDEHKTSGVYGKEDYHYFLDIDIAYLGFSSDDYAKYRTKVEEEYKFLPEGMYRDLRKKVLKNFLQIPNIFATKEFREKYENSARSNIQTEVDALKNNK